MAQTTAESGSNAAEMTEAYEEIERGNLEALLRSARRFVDVGANKGVYTRLASQVMTNCEIVSVEANPDLARRLEAAAREWSAQSSNAIRVLNYAASDTAGELEFAIGTTDTLGSAARELPPDQLVGKIKIPARPLDDLLEPIADTVVKIDVEGFEYRVLTGAARLMSAPRTRIVVEMHGWGDRSIGKYPFHVLALMMERSFAVRRVPGTWHYAFEKAGRREAALSFARHAPLQFAKYVARAAGLRGLLGRAR